MKRRDLLLTGAGGALALGMSAFPWQWTAAKDGRRRHLLMFTRSAGFQHSVIARREDELSTAEEVVTVLGRQHGFDVTCTKDGGVFDGDLDRFDAIFFYTTGDLTGERSADGQPGMSREGKQRLLDAVAAGKGFLGSHCASDTFHSAGPAGENQDEPDPYIVMLGGEFIVHGAQQEATLRLVSPGFPGTSGLGEQIRLLEEWYALKNFTPDLHVILVQETADMQGPMYQRPPFPATWARQHGEGRVFYTSLGHREDIWANRHFQELLLGALSWTFRQVDADVTPNIKSVTPDAWVLRGTA